MAILLTVLHWIYTSSRNYKIVIGDQQEKFVKTCWDLLPIKSIPCNDEKYKSNGANNRLID